jgi:hypothetical protein
MGSEEYMYDMDNDQIVVKDGENPYWERVHDVGNGGVVFGNTEIPDTQILPHPGGRSAEVLKRALIQDRDMIHQLQHSSLFELQNPRSAHDHGHVTLIVNVPMGSYDMARCCSQTSELAFETIVDRFFEEGEILKLYIAVDRSLLDVAHRLPASESKISDLSLTNPKSKPSDKELRKQIRESGFHDEYNIRSFDESNYSNESSETNDNSPPDEHIVDIEYDASEIDDGTDFETEMYKVANQTENEDHIGEVVEYNPDMDDESVEIVVRCPDQSIGLLEYDFPETESASNSEFVSMINCARETKLVADDEGNIEQTHAEITLDSIERLKNAEIPLKEHKDTWVVATSNELDTDNETDSVSTSDFRIDYKWVSSKAIGVGRAMFWVTSLPIMVQLFLTSKAVDGDTISNFVGDIHERFDSDLKIYILMISLLMWSGVIDAFLL